MRKVLVVASIVLVAACSVAPSPVAVSPTPSLAAPSATVAETASPAPPATPVPTPNRTEAPIPTQPPQAAPPGVTVVSQAFSVGLVASLTEVQGKDRTDAEAMVRAWAPIYLQGLDKFRSEFSDANRALFESLHVPGPYAELIRASVQQWYGPPGGGPPRTFELQQLTIQHVYAKPWGRVAFIDATISYLDRVTSTDGKTTSQPRVQRVRLANQGRGSLRVIDGFDPVLNRWVDGEQARWSALALEAEAPFAVSSFLQRESYVPGEQYPHTNAPGTPIFLDSAFEKAHNESLQKLDAGYAAKEFATRRFDGVTVRIGRFEPATFLGDGVVTVLVNAGLTVAPASGQEKATNVTRTLRFYRITRDGLNAFWQAVDEQTATGDWLSGGQLALALIDQDRG